METKTKKVVINYKAKYEAAMKEIDYRNWCIDEKSKQIAELEGGIKELTEKYNIAENDLELACTQCNSLRNDNAILSQMLDKAQAELNTIKASWWYKVAKFFGVWD